MDDFQTPERISNASEIPERDSSHTAFRSALPATERQLRVLVAIEEFLASRGYPPTVRALCGLLGMTSTNGMSDHLAALERKGYIARDRPVARAIRVLVPSAYARLSEPRHAPPRKTIPCPHCGRRVVA